MAISQPPRIQNSAPTAPPIGNRLSAALPSRDTGHRHPIWGELLPNLNICKPLRFHLCVARIPPVVAFLNSLLAPRSLGRRVLLLLLDAAPLHAEAIKDAEASQDEGDLEACAQRVIVGNQGCIVVLRWDDFEEGPQCLVEVYYLRPRRYTVDTLCFYYALEKFQARDSEFGAYVALGIIVRVATRLGYHRDASHYPNISPFDGEMRKRVWSMIFQLDLMTSAQVVLPRMIREEETDTAEPKKFIGHGF